MWLLVFTGFFCILAFLVCLTSRSQDISSHVEGKTVLLVTAHPDDECMFFAPTLLSTTTHSSTKVILLCLTIGDYYNQGNVRKHELNRSAAVLGIHSDHVVLVNDSALPDSPTVKWDTSLVEEHIQTVISQHRPNVIITFDEKGVSGHLNHIALYRAVRNLKTKGLLHSGPHSAVQVLLLETTGLLRKYTSCLDWFLGSFFARYHSACDFRGYLKGRQAMQEHKSQYLWFRRLWLIFSRYMYINTFKQL